MKWDYFRRISAGEVADWIRGANPAVEFTAVEIERTLVALDFVVKRALKSWPWIYTAGRIDDLRQEMWIFVHRAAQAFTRDHGALFQTFVGYNVFNSVKNWARYWHGRYQETDAMGVIARSAIERGERLNLDGLIEHMHARYRAT